MSDWHWPTFDLIYIWRCPECWEMWRSETLKAWAMMTECARCGCRHFAETI